MPLNCEYCDRRINDIGNAVWTGGFPMHESCYRELGEELEKAFPLDPENDEDEAGYLALDSFSPSV